MEKKLKKNNKKVFIILGIVLCLIVIGVGGYFGYKYLIPHSEESGSTTGGNTSTISKCGKVNLDYFEIKGEDKKTLWGLTDLGKEQEILVIPSGIDHFLGSELGKNASYKTVCFESDEDVDIRSAFDNSENLETITLPANLTHDFTINNSPKLKEITIPAGIDNIPNFAFLDDTSLKTVTFKGNNVKAIYTGAFKGCTSLESINLPDSIETIYGNAFEGCTSLKSITLPKSLTYITNAAFVNSGIKTINVPEELELVSWTKDPYKMNIKGCTVKVYKNSWMDIHFDEVFGSDMTKEYYSTK